MGKVLYMHCLVHCGADKFVRPATRVCNHSVHQALRLRSATTSTATTSYSRAVGKHPRTWQTSCFKATQAIQHHLL